MQAMNEIARTESTREQEREKDVKAMGAMAEIEVAGKIYGWRRGGKPAKASYKGFQFLRSQEK